MKYWLSLFSALLISLSLNAQKPDAYFSFENNLNSDNVRDSVSYRGTPNFEEGIHGSAWNLSRTSPSRFPVALLSKDAQFQKDNFSVSVWVKIPENIVGNNLIIGTKNPGIKDYGWAIYENNGSYGIEISDSTYVFKYEPTHRVQPINDGKWHLLSLSISLENMEAKFYYDGRNRGIYNLTGLKDDLIRKNLFIGGYKSEENAFTGFIDELSIFNRVVLDAEIIQEYEKYLKYKYPPKYNPGDDIKVMAWNIWHGGREHGEQAGVSRVVEVIEDSRADIIGMIETYGSGAIISDSLGYYFYLISTNLSIMSKYPIEETMSIYKPFNSGGAFIRLNDNQKIAFIDLWLHYLPSVDKIKNVKNLSVDSIINEEGKTRHAEIKAILSEIPHLIKNADEVPLFMVGDYNSGTHLDWTKKAKSLHNDYVIKWPVTVEMEKAGMSDSYRTFYPDEFKNEGRTWSPIFKGALQRRIDYVYFKSKKLFVEDSKMLDSHPVKWPSDHSAVITTFKIK